MKKSILNLIGSYLLICNIIGIFCRSNIKEVNIYFNFIFWIMFGASLIICIGLFLKTSWGKIAGFIYFVIVIFFQLLNIWKFTMTFSVQNNAFIFTIFFIVMLLFLALHIIFSIILYKFIKSDKQ